MSLKTCLWDRLPQLSDLAAMDLSVGRFMLSTTENYLMFLLTLTRHNFRYCQLQQVGRDEYSTYRSKFFSAIELLCTHVLQQEHRNHVPAVVPQLAVRILYLAWGNPFAHFFSRLNVEIFSKLENQSHRKKSCFSGDESLIRKCMP